MTRAALVAAFGLCFATVGCGPTVFDVRDFDGDRQPPQITRLEALTDREEFLVAMADPVPPPLSECPDGRFAPELSRRLEAPVRIIRAVARDDDSGIQTITVRIEGADILAARSNAPGSARIDKVSAQSAAATFRAEFLGENKVADFDVALSLPTAPNRVVWVWASASDATGKSIDLPPYRLGDRAALCSLQ